MTENEALPELLRDAVTLDGRGGLRVDVNLLARNMAAAIAAAAATAMEDAARIAEDYEPNPITTAKQMLGLMVAHLPPQQAIAFAIRRAASNPSAGPAPSPAPPAPRGEP